VEATRSIASPMIIDHLFPVARFLPACSWPRALAKTLTWRFFATLDTFLISMLVTRNLKLAGSIVGIEVLTKMVWYLLHERAWARLSLAAEPAMVRAAAHRYPDARVTAAARSRDFD
jgi:uncharacterized membrane protein